MMGGIPPAVAWRACGSSRTSSFPRLPRRVPNENGILVLRPARLRPPSLEVFDERQSCAVLMPTTTTTRRSTPSPATSTRRCAKRTMQWAEIDGRQAPARRRQGQPVHPQPDVRPGRRSPARSTTTSAAATRRATDTARAVRRARADPRPSTATATPGSRVMDEQGIEGAIFLPTLGVGMEEALIDDLPRRCTPRSARSTAGSTRTGASPTRTASSPRRTSRWSTPTRRSSELRVGARPRRPRSS